MAPGTDGYESASTRADIPRISERRTNSCLTSVEICPTYLIIQFNCNINECIATYASKKLPGLLPFIELQIDVSDIVVRGLDELCDQVFHAWIVA